MSGHVDLGLDPDDHTVKVYDHGDRLVLEQYVERIWFSPMAARVFAQVLLDYADGADD